MTDSVSTQRRIDLDWIRIAAFGVLILYHIGMYYVSWGFHVKSPHASRAIEPLMLLVNPWRLGLLFLVSGAATAFMLSKMTAGSLARLRSWRLLVPLIFGMLVIVPPQSYFEVVEKAGYAGTYGEFWLRYLSGDHSFCDKDGCLIVPTWNHLWFVAYLWAYTMLLAAAAALWRGNTARWLAPLERALAGPGIIIWPWLWLALARFCLADRFPATHALAGDWYNHALYLPLFLFGFVFARSEMVWSAIVRWRWVALALAVASSAGVITYITFFASDSTPMGLRLIMRAVHAGSMDMGRRLAGMGPCRHPSRQSGAPLSDRRDLSVLHCSPDGDHRLFPMAEALCASGCGGSAPSGGTYRADLCPFL